MRELRNWQNGVAIALKKGRLWRGGVVQEGWKGEDREAVADRCNSEPDSLTPEIILTF